MYQPAASQDILGKLRRRAARMALNYPTDPISLTLGGLGAIMLLITLLIGTDWITIAAGAFTLASGVVGLLAARTNRLMLYALRITVISANLAFVLVLFSLAAYPIWWLSVIPLGVGLTGLTIFYWGVRRSLLTIGLQILATLLSTLIMETAANIDTGQVVQFFAAGEIIQLTLNFGVLLLMPEQTERQARSSALAQQSSDLDNLTLQISATADGLGRAVTAIHTVTTQQGSGAEQQAAVITQAVTMLNEFIALANQVRDQSRGVANLSEKTAEISASGQGTIRNSIEGMSQIRDQVTVITHNIAALAEQMQRIDEIINSVSEIATQSNLLALNASIEAARAGVHGRGFAVVADEVRTLAQQSQAAAAQVQSILGEIQDAMKQTVRATQVGDQQVDKGLELSRRSGEVIKQLADNVTESTEAMRNIMVAIEQQTTGLEQITQSMRNIHDVTQQNLESTRTAEIVAQNLSRLSEELLTAIARHTGEGLAVN